MLTRHENLAAYLNRFRLKETVKYVKYNCIRPIRVDARIRETFEDLDIGLKGWQSSGQRNEARNTVGRGSDREGQLPQGRGRGVG